MLRESHLDVFGGELALSGVAANGTKKLGSSLDFDPGKKPFNLSRAKLKIWVTADATAADTKAPTLTVYIGSKTSASGATMTYSWTSQTFALATLKKGKVLVDMTLPDNLDQIVQIAVADAHATDVFTGGKIRGDITPYVG